MRTLKTCPNCGKPLCYDIVDTTFTTETVPSHALTMQLQASWCPTKGCYHVVSPYNVVDMERHLFIDEVCRARDVVQQIADGLIERGHRQSQYDSEPGKRKMKLPEAKTQAKIAIDRINAAIRRFDP